MADPGSTEIVPKAAQPANFAKSKADILQTLQYYFGDPAYPQKLMDYTEHHAATGHLCAANILELVTPMSMHTHATHTLDTTCTSSHNNS